MSPSPITEINKDTFWVLMTEAKEHCGQNQDAFLQWVENRLLEMAPEQALNFDAIIHGYRELAHKYGLWTAASILCDGCTDDGFIDFRGWLIAQGKEVYMAALKDPDSLASITTDGQCCFECISYAGNYAYEKLTGRNANSCFDRATYLALVEELKKDIVYGKGVDCPYTWSEAAIHLPKLCGKYLRPEELAWRIKYHDNPWNMTSPEIKKARAAAEKDKRTRSKKKREKSR